ncbi:MAG: FAD-binding monooxygenase [Chloroflexi bacterium]|nr:FAD-binding monooxygenase [Chloroflexota bacterium]
MATPSATSHALVLGASMAGLLTARVLSKHFAQVTIVERDVVPDQPEARKGQPQTRHLHGLLASGLEIMTRYYPDLPDALAAGGALVIDMTANMCWYTYGGYRRRFTMGRKGALMSRPFLEHLIRQRTLARDNVTLLDSCAIRGLVTGDDRRRITGVRVEHRDAQSLAATLTADLVVDCTGRGSQTPQWLLALGYPAPPQSEVKVNVGYATRLYRRDPADPRGQDWLLYTPEAPGERRFGGMFPIEGERWIVSLGGWTGDHAPTDEQGFLEYARSLPMPEIYALISQAEPLSDIIPHKFPASLRRHYERLTRFPEGYLVLGDAVCSFNPTYGQGMTSAAMQAAALDELLTLRMGRLDGLARAFFKRAAQVIDTPWQLAVGEDFRFPDTTGPKPAGVDLLNRYVAAVHRATLVDPVVGAAFIRVMNLLAPPLSLMSPAMLLRVLRGASQRRAPAVARGVERGVPS